jgi:cytochrome c biogenesis protein ResB
MTELGLEELKPGESWTTDQGYEVKFQAIEQFATFQVAYEPGRFLALIGAIFAMLGMFFGVIEVAGLAKSTNHDVNKDLEKLLEVLGVKGLRKKGDRSI